MKILAKSGAFLAAASAVMVTQMAADSNAFARTQSVEVQSVVSGDSDTSSSNGLIVSANDVQDQLARRDGAYAGVAIDYDSNTVTVYRVGGSVISPELLQDYTSTMKAGITLRFAAALLSAAQYKHLNSIVQSVQNDLANIGVTLTTWGQANGYDEPFEIQYVGDAAIPQAIVSQVQVYGSSTVIFRPNGQPVTPADRNGDTNPFFGGGASRTNAVVVGNEVEVGLATTGFIFEDLSNNDILASEAWHSQTSSSGTQYFATNGVSGGSYLGTVSRQDHDQDTAFVDISAAGRAGAGYIYSGGYNSPGTTRQITGENLHQPVGGQFVCEGGASSGIHCNIKYIKNPAVTYPLTDPFDGHQATVKAYEAFEGSGATAVADGDSGGAVYNADGSSGAVADGVVSAFASGDKISCPAYVTNNRPALSNPQCAHTVYIVSLTDIITVQPNLAVVGF